MRACARRRWSVGSVAWALVAGCGASSPVVEEPRAEVVPPNDNVPVAEAPAEPVAPPPSAPAERAVLVDGVRGAIVLDELAGWRLVGGAGTLALVGPDGHVRASHRFAFGADGATGVFLDASRVITGNGDHDGFRGPWSGRLSRWSLDTDTVEQLRSLGYAAPYLARLDGVVAVVSPSEQTLHGVTAGTLDDYGDYAVDQLGWAPGRPPECYVGDGERSWLARSDGRGHLVLTDVNGPTPETPLAPAATGLAMSPSLGARGMPSAELAPGGQPLAISTSSTMVLVGVDGISQEVPSQGYLQWQSDAALQVGQYFHPLAAPTLHRVSMLVDHVPYPNDSEGPAIPEISAFSEWQYRAQEAQEQGGAIPALPLEPVCSRAPVRCVRAHLDGTDLDGWELFDPARPGRVLARIEERDWPPGQGYVVVAPGGRFLRVFGEGASIRPLPRGEPITDIQSWVELESGWVYVDPQDATIVRFLPFRGRPIERVFAAEVASVSLVDATHVLVRVQGDPATAHVLAVPGLITDRSFDLVDGGGGLRCHDGHLADRDGELVAEDGCPVQGLDPEVEYSITASRDGAFWMDARLGDELIVHRAADGASLRVRVTTAGVLVSGPGGVFEGTGEILDHVVVREPGPVREAAITAGAEARARFERPGLAAAFFRGDPLPTAP